jgi:hypothetical protein
MIRLAVLSTVFINCVCHVRGNDLFSVRTTNDWSRGSGNENSVVSFSDTLMKGDWNAG